MIKRNVPAVVLMIILCLAITGCGSSNAAVTTAGDSRETTAGKQNDEAKIDLEDGTYTADFTTDSSMFHVNEALDGKGTLTVKDGKATLHVSLVSENIINMYVGLAADAETASESDLLQPTTDTVTYSDGTTEEVYGFDIPVSCLDEDFDLAILGTKGTWYDHKVSVSNPVSAE